MPIQKYLWTWFLWIRIQTALIAIRVTLFLGSVCWGGGWPGRYYEHWAVGVSSRPPPPPLTGCQLTERAMQATQCMLIFQPGTTLQAHKSLNKTYNTNLKPVTRLLPTCCLLNIPIPVELALMASEESFFTRSCCRSSWISCVRRSTSPCSLLQFSQLITTYERAIQSEVNVRICGMHRMVAEWPSEQHIGW